MTWLWAVRGITSGPRGEGAGHDWVLVMARAVLEGVDDGVYVFKPAEARAAEWGLPAVGAVVPGVWSPADISSDLPGARSTVAGSFSYASGSTKAVEHEGHAVRNFRGERHWWWGLPTTSVLVLGDASSRPTVVSSRAGAAG